jgi:outer membrane biosynthesis protein TonB
VSRGESGRLRRALLASTAVHLGVIGGVWLLTSRGEELPPMRVYAVNIVSPPPQSFGEPRAAAAQPEPEPEPEAEPESEPEPEPEVEPEPAPPPPPPPPPTTAPRQQTAPPPPPPPPPPEEPPPQPREAPPAQAAAASTGPQPDPSSPGGEGITAQLRGVQCPTPEYCNNIIRQIHRYFRSPGAGAAGDADVYFQINRDGSISDLRLISSTGGAGFRLAVMEAVEQAGLNRAFGPLPQPYRADQLPVSFYFRPSQ